MQAYRAWLPPSGTLGQIVAETKARIDELNRHRRTLEARAANSPVPPPLTDALHRADVGVIAEVKRRSPSQGEINAGLLPDAAAAGYHAGGAAAISVLTEARHFGGSPDDLLAVRAVVPLPILKKDFHLDAIQLIEARALGASAVLLIARSMHPRALASLAAESLALGLEALIEVRTEAELDESLSMDAGMIGVNSRDLETLAIEPAVAERLLPLIPARCIAIAESGVLNRGDVERLASWGADGVLVGSALSAASDARSAVRALTGVHRRSRAA